MPKRFFDIFFSIVGIVILSPILLIISIWIILDSRGGVLYLQNRVGRNNKDFKLFKFRTMQTGADQKGLLTVGSKDLRITKAGYYLRKYKIDELPQLFNVLFGNMSFVGPRPEVRKYVELYTPEQLKVLSVKPGITDHASLLYFEESDLLSRSSNPEETYIKEVMPAKLKINLKYVEEHSFWSDLQIIIATIGRIFA